MSIKVISNTEVVDIDESCLDTRKIGKKGLGLVKIPSPWSLPFICVSADVYNNYAESDQNGKKAIIKLVAERIRENLQYLGVSKDGMLIIRSSGADESLKDRGKYDSKECKTYDIEKTMESLFEGIASGKDKNLMIGFVIQKYIDAKVKGHLSNERRFSRVKRDWIFEYENIQTKEKHETGRISIRPWRKELPDELSRLECTEIKKIDAMLEYIASYYYSNNKKNSVHFEFVWDGESMYLVQADEEEIIKEGKTNPTAINIKVNSTHLVDFEVLREVSEGDTKFPKIKNHFVYKELGLPIVPLYILQGEEYISQLRKKKISEELKRDFKKMANNSVVIRSDVVPSDEEDGKLLARSNELRSFDEIIKWLFDQTSLLNSKAEICFIFHVFIPAIGAAFVDVSPHSRIVSIEALWGLPEGLYYNAYDKIIVDTKAVETETLDEKYVEIKRKKCAYKENYIAPDDSGKWVLKKTMDPYDWECCIDDDSIKDIATKSRVIADNCNKRISVMWFIGIDESYYKTKNLPWYHEEYSLQNYTTANYKKKYFAEGETVIRNVNDYEQFLQTSNIKEIRLCPTDDSLLRNKTFLKSVGERANEIGASIILEGTVLAHPLYQLLNTGARVFTATETDDYGVSENFRKLVRDGIPEKILSNGEGICCYALEKDAFLRALLEKTVEEACEIVSATSNEEIVEELADELEVMNAIESVLHSISKVSHSQDKIKKVKTSEFSNNEIVSKHGFSLLQNPSGYSTKTQWGYLVQTVSREKNQLQIEWHFFKNVNSPESIKKRHEDAIEEKKVEIQILKSAFSIVGLHSKKSIENALRNIKKEIEKLLAEKEIDKKNVIRVMKSKKEKRGGFEKGYILESSYLGNGSEKEDPQIELPLPVTAYPQKDVLDYLPVKYIDYLDKNNGEIIFRISLPLCFDYYEETIDSPTVNKYFGENQAIMIRARRTGSNLCAGFYLNLETGSDSGEQLSF